MTSNTSSHFIFDETQIARQRSRHATGPDGRYFLFDRIADNLAERLTLIRRDFPVCVRIGARGKGIQKSIHGLRHLFTVDRVSEGATISAKEDFWPFRKESIDLVLGVASLHSVNDLPGALFQIRQSVHPDGAFLAALFGGGTLFELRDCLYQAEQEVCGGISPRVHPFADMRQLGGLMQRAGFALPVIDSEKIVVTYPSMFGLMRDLRHMGEANVTLARRKNFTPGSLFLRAAEIYSDRYAEADGRIPATFEIIYMLGWAPHEGQQKPLRPGSATSRLADALKNDSTDF